MLWRGSANRAIHYISHPMSKYFNLELDLIISLILHTASTLNNNALPVS